MTAGVTSQNRSPAVMNRRIEPPDSLDDFPTPPWATRVLFEHVLIPAGADVPRLSVWEPACNRGHMAAPIAEYAPHVLATDIADYSGAVDLSPHWVRSGVRADGVLDFTDGRATGRSAYEARFRCPPGLLEPPERWVITNPPFNAAVAFHAAGAGLGAHMAFFLRTSFVESETRYETLFAPHADPPAIIAHFAERVCLLKGRLVRKDAIDPFHRDNPDPALPAGVKPKDHRASTATSYAWFIWNRAWREAFGGTRTVWIPKGAMAACERPGDYPDYPPGYFTQSEAGVAPDMAPPPVSAQTELFI